MSVIGTPSEEEVASAWMAAMHDVVEVKTQNDIPELNEYQCGTYKMHSLDDAKSIAKHVIDAKIGINKNEDIALSEDILKGL